MSIEGGIPWLLLVLLVVFGVRFLGLCSRTARLERELLLMKRGISALVFDAKTWATVPEYQQALENLQKELGENYWVAGKREKDLAGDD